MFPFITLANLRPVALGHVFPLCTSGPNKVIFPSIDNLITDRHTHSSFRWFGLFWELMFNVPQEIEQARQDFDDCFYWLLSFF